MRKAGFFLLFVTAALNTVAQQDSITYTKGMGGVEYKVYSKPGATKIQYGQYFEMETISTYRDTAITNTIEDGMPLYAQYDSATFPPAFKEILRNIKLGDSIILRVPTDSLIKNGQAAPNMVNGYFLYQTYMVTNVYTTQKAVDSALQSHVKPAKAIADRKYNAAVEKILGDNHAQLELDNKKIEAYLAGKNIKAFKSRWGAYIVIKKPGSGPNATGESTVTLNYTGKSFDGKAFDSNTDPKFKHVEPLNVQLSRKGVIIPGWEDALLYLNKGSKATVYLPSTLGYGTTGMGDIKPNEILIFELDILDIRAENAVPKNTPKAVTPAKVIAKPKIKKAAP